MDSGFKDHGVGCMLAGTRGIAATKDGAGRDVVQTFTGLMPPYSRLRRLGYQISQFGFTAVK